MAPGSRGEDERLEKIRLISSTADLAFLGGETVENPEDDEEEAWSVDAFVTRLGGDRFRLETPTSLTPFGSLGPCLNTGDVIHATHRGDGTYRWLGMVERARVWSVQVGGMSQEALEAPQVRRILEQVDESGGGWEWTADTLTVQFPLGPHESEPPHGVRMHLEKLRRLADSL